jgi:hypothetical protein
MSLERIEEQCTQATANLENKENTDEALDLTLEELSTISGGLQPEIRGNNNLKKHRMELKIALIRAL